MISMAGSGYEAYRNEVVSADLTLLPESHQTSREEAEEVRAMLLGEFALAHAPITGRRLASVIKTGNGNFYVGHNHEDSSGNRVQFNHAETDALQSMLRNNDSGIETIFMGCENSGQIKRISPCSDCYTSLKPSLLPHAELILFEPHSLDRALVFSAEELREAYEPKPYSAIMGGDLETATEELREKTILNEQDIKIAVALRELGIHKNISFYLTGSSSGRGWISNAINRKLGREYSDMDVIGVSSVPPEFVRDQVQELLAQRLGPVSRHQVSHDAWIVSGSEKGTPFKNDYTVFETPSRKIMDLVIAKSLGQGMRRQDYLENNRFHRLS